MKKLFIVFLFALSQTAAAAFTDADLKSYGSVAIAKSTEKIWLHITGPAAKSLFTGLAKATQDEVCGDPGSCMQVRRGKKIACYNSKKKYHCEVYFDTAGDFPTDVQFD